MYLSVSLLLSLFLSEVSSRSPSIYSTVLVHIPPYLITPVHLSLFLYPSTYISKHHTQHQYLFINSSRSLYIDSATRICLYLYMYPSTKMFPHVCVCLFILISLSFSNFPRSLRINLSITLPKSTYMHMCVYTHIDICRATQTYTHIMHAFFDLSHVPFTWISVSFYIYLPISLHLCHNLSAPPDPINHVCSLTGK